MGCLEAWVPRGLLTNAADVLSASVTAEGLSPVRVYWQQGRLRSLEPIDADVSLPQRLLLPRLVDPHVHLDKAFTWLQSPNLQGKIGRASCRERV